MQIEEAFKKRRPVARILLIDGFIKSYGKTNPLNFLIDSPSCQVTIGDVRPLFGRKIDVSGRIKPDSLLLAADFAQSINFMTA